MCNCSRRSSTTAGSWEVRYPAGSGKTTERKTTEVAAQLAAARVPGATVEKVQ